ncbi:Protein kinase domain [seawater metagenome]|uniref:Protein kinase domain n=1 Tax=seawater metagenome TaxID=1561972 RepID=A0A5E8CKA2_9ZZZZ
MNCDITSLTPEEQEEAKMYKSIYFTGINNKNKLGDKDDKNRYLSYKGDHIGFRFEILSNFGHGAFSNVVKVLDHKNKEERVIKIIRDEVRFHKQAKIELNILTKINEEIPNIDSIIHCLKSFEFRNHKCFVFDVYYMNLYEYMKTNYIKLSLVKNYTLQLLQTLKYLEELKIIHADFKPENIMIKDETAEKLVLIDFGSSFIEEDHNNYYIQSRWYRAPEIILGHNKIDCKIDLWSLGCMVFEMSYRNIPLFNGKDSMHQLFKMIEIIGVPSPDFLKQCKYTSCFENEELYKWKKFKPSKTIKSFNLINDDKIGEFLKQVIRWDPNYRIDIENSICLLLD